MNRETAGKMQLASLIACLICAAAASSGSEPPTVEVQQIDNSGAPELAGYVTQDIVYTTETDWLSAQLVVELEQPNGIYQHGLGASQPLSPNPEVIENGMPPILPPQPALAFDTYLSTGVLGETVSVLAPVDMLEFEVIFNQNKLAACWFVTDRDNIGELALARVTLSEQAVGIWQFMGTSSPFEGPKATAIGFVQNGTLTFGRPADNRPDILHRPKSGPTYVKEGPDPGQWSNPDNWDGHVPTADKPAYIDNGGTILVGSDTAQAERLYVGHNIAGTGTVELTGGQLQLNSYLVVGSQGVGTFRQVGGLNDSSYITLGSQYFGIGAYEMIDGKLDTSDLYVGYSGQGTFEQLGGISNVSRLHLGENRDGYGEYHLSGGQLSADSESIGRSGTGVFTQSGGVNKVSSLGVHRGTYELSGGLLSANREYIGGSGPGVFTQTGGINEVAGGLHIGGDHPGGAAYTVSGGSLSVQDLNIGTSHDSTASFNITGRGATITVSDELVFQRRARFTAVEGSEIHMTGSTFENYSTDPVAMAGLENLTLIFEGGEGITSTSKVVRLVDTSAPRRLELGGDGVAHTFEAARLDTSARLDGLVDDFAPRRLELGGDERTRVSGLAQLDTLILRSVRGIAKTSELAQLVTVAPSDGLVDYFAPPTLQPVSKGITSTFEIAGMDLGATSEGLVDNFALDTLQLGGEAGVGEVMLVDLFDNQPDWQGAEALYVENLLLGAGSRLDLNGLNLYYGSFTDLGGTIYLSGGTLSHMLYAGTFAQVPEPSAMAMLALGGGLALCRRKRREAHK